MYGAHSDKPLRGDYSRAKADFSVEQRDHIYSDEDHALWRRLYARQAQLLQSYACREFRDGLTLMDAADGVPDLDDVNARLEPVSGWRLIAVPRSEEQTSELQSTLRSSYAVFCLKKKK